MEPPILEKPEIVEAVRMNASLIWYSYPEITGVKSVVGTPYEYMYFVKRRVAKLKHYVIETGQSICAV